MQTVRARLDRFNRLGMTFALCSWCVMAPVIIVLIESGYVSRDIGTHYAVTGMWFSIVLTMMIWGVLERPTWLVNESSPRSPAHRASESGPR